MLNALYISTLLKLPGVGRKKVQRLLYSSTLPKIENLGQLHDLVKQRLSKKITLGQLKEAYSQAQETVHQLERHHIQQLAPSDPHFPAQLRNIPDPPVLLYVKGNAELLSSSHVVAVIGTRGITALGRHLGTEIAKTLAASSVVVVSGLAVGCDTVAHKGCLEAQGKTVAILAHGLDMIYPSENSGLAKQILSTGGCLVSEYAPGVKVKPYQFVERDRLQSGLSQAVIIIETGVKGGTMHTVGFAKTQKRLLACINPPREKVSSSNAGNQQLIKDGAFPINTTKDVSTFIKKISSSDCSVSRYFTREKLGTCKLSDAKSQTFFKPELPSPILKRLEPMPFFNYAEKTTSKKRKSSGVTLIEDTHTKIPKPLEKPAPLTEAERQRIAENRQKALLKLNKGKTIPSLT